MYDCFVINKNKYVLAKMIQNIGKERGKKKKEGGREIKRGRREEGCFSIPIPDSKTLSVDLVPCHLAPST